MKNILTAFVTLAMAAALAGCGDNSSAPAPTPAPTPAPVVDRTLTLNVSLPRLFNPGEMSADVAGIATSSSNVILSFPAVPAGTLGLVSVAGNQPQSAITVLPDPANGIYTATVVSINLPSGRYPLKAVSVGDGPAFRTYSTSVFYSVK